MSEALKAGKMLLFRAQKEFAGERLGKKPVDYVLLSILCLIAGIGLVMLFSASYYRAERLFSDPGRFFRRQFLWIILGAVVAVPFSRVSIEYLRKKTQLFVMICFGLMMLSFVPGVGVQFLGARRWIFFFGYSFQPSELVKLGLVLYLAHILDVKHDRLDDPVNSLLPPVIIVAIFTGMIYLQNDFSTSFFVITVALAVFFIADVRLRYFLSLAVMTLPVSLILLLSREHRVNRILAFVDPNRDPAGAGYQILASRSALAHGGLWGAGIGQSTRKFGGLPEAHSDFVFAIVAEELGFIGVCVVLSLFMILAYRGYQLAHRAADRYRSYLAFGLTTSIVLQSLLNMAVVSGLAPATGIPLPFFSSGGSSIFVTLIMCGILLNLSRENGLGEERYNG
jgi:cell division protein FtsW